MKKIIFLLAVVACLGLTQAQTIKVTKIYAYTLGGQPIDLETEAFTFSGSISRASLRFGFDITNETSTDLPSGTVVVVKLNPFNAPEENSYTLTETLKAGETIRLVEMTPYSLGQYNNALTVITSNVEWKANVCATVTKAPNDLGKGSKVDKCVNGFTIKNTTSIALSQMENVSVYPTTITDNMLKINGLENTNVSIFGINGQLVSESQSLNGDVVLDMSNYAPGMYLVKLKNNNQSKVVKVQLIK